MGSIPPLSNLLVSRDTDIEVTGTLGHRKVSFKKGAKVENYSLTQVLQAIKNVEIAEGSPELKSLKEKVDIIQDALSQLRIVMRRGHHPMYQIFLRHR